MQRATSLQQSQAAAQSTSSLCSRPVLLDLRDLARVSGGLPRGGGWIETASAKAVETTAASAQELPRGGGW